MCLPTSAELDELIVIEVNVVVSHAGMLLVLSTRSIITYQW
jgi:hypothetical protein